MSGEGVSIENGNGEGKVIFPHHRSMSAATFGGFLDSAPMPVDYFVDEEGNRYFPKEGEGGQFLDSHGVIWQKTN